MAGNLYRHFFTYLMDCVLEPVLITLTRGGSPLYCDISLGNAALMFKFLFWLKTLTFFVFSVTKTINTTPSGPVIFQVKHPLYRPAVTRSYLLCTGMLYRERQFIVYHISGTMPQSFVRNPYKISKSTVPK